MTNDLILRVSYNGSIYDLDVLNEVPLRVDMSTVEVGQVGRLFGIGSQQFTLPGTKKNNRFFKNAYDPAADNPPGMYNSIDGWVIQNGETLLTGQFQVLEIVTDEDGFVNYNVQISDRVVQFNEEIKGKFLKDGDWSAYSHTLSSGSILDSWDDNLLSGGIFYPLAAFGRDDDNQDLTTYPALGFSSDSIGSSLIPLKTRQFLPAIKLKNVVDVIFDQVGFSYTGSFMETNDFNNLYLLTKADDTFGPTVPEASATFEAVQLTPQTYSLGIIGSQLIATTEISDPQNAYNTTTSTYTAKASGDHTLAASITFANNSFDSGGPGGVNTGRVTVELRAGSSGSYTVVSTGEYNYDTFDPDPITLTVTGQQSMTAGVDDYFAVISYIQTAGTGTLPSLYVSNITLECTAAPTVFEGTTIDMSLQFNPQLKSEDVIKGLLTQFNLVMIPDVYNPSVIQIETFDSWMRQGELKDWNDKYDASKRVSINHTINELPKNIILSNAEDNDRFSVIAKEQEPYRQYGALELIATSNNALGEDKLETVFVPVVLGSSLQTDSSYPNLDLPSSTVFPHLYKYDNDKLKSYAFKPRIGYKVTNTLPSGSSIYLGLQGALEEVSGSYSTLSNLSQLPAVSGSTNDLHFNNTYQDFGPAALGLDNGVTAFEAYWETYYNSLYWDDAKKVTISAKFDPSEYKDIKLNDRIMIKNQYYRINKIKGYNVSYRDVVTVELIRLYPAYFQLGT